MSAVTDVTDVTNANHQIAMIGLGRMGGNMAKRMARAGIKVVGFDAMQATRELFNDEAGIQTFASLEQTVAALNKDNRPNTSRTIWVMLPAGEVTESTLLQLRTLLKAGDLVIDGGNCNYLDSQRRGQEFTAKQIEFMDCGVSGGVWGLANGYCLMYGGSDAAAQQLKPFVEALAPSKTDGWVHCGPVGSGHFAKMVHNGIEYGMMQAFAEGFALMAGKKEFDFKLDAVGEAWRHGSVVRSWLLDLTAQALRDPASIAAVSPIVADSGEGRWTIDEAIRQGTPTPVIALSVMSRFDSQGKADFGNRLLAMMRKGFGGHSVEKNK
jgi:6-phosphogluconate dehydrogenase